VTAELDVASAIDPSDLPAEPYTTGPTSPTDGRHIAVAVARTVGAALALPLALYVVLRPENYGLTPNTLDPFFYTGYAINFDDIMNAVRGRHYLVSRWSAYYPGYIADALAGPFVGRLLLRLVLAAAILLSIWGMGRRWQWTRAQQLLIGVLVLTMPMFVRAFFTDYVEYMVVALGICLVAICLRERQTALSAAISGALAALIVVANPIAITSIVLPLAVCVLLGGRRVRDKAFIAAVIAGAGAVVVMGGLVIFRWRYGIDNVYQPSIDFIRNYRGRDLLKSPRREWLWHFTWLFATPIVLVSAAGLAWRRSVRFERVEVVAFAMAGLQYLYQWLDQFVRDGDGLEISYYWSFAYPTFAVAFAVFIGRLTRTISSVPLVIGSLAWILFLLIGVPDAFRLPAGVGFAIVALVAVGGVIAVCRRSTVAALAIVVGLVGWTQIGAPRYDPSSYFQFNMSPRYDDLFRMAGDISEMAYREAVWFEEQMDTIANDASTSFVVLGNWSSNIVGLYAPHVVGHMVPVDPETGRLSRVGIAEIRTGSRPIVAVLGPPGDVATMIATFPEDLGVGSLLLDVTHASALGYRLVVYDMPDSAILPFTWNAADLPIASGRIRGGAVEADEGEPAGFVTFGPYLPLRPGKYAVVLRASSSAPPGQVVGTFDVSSTDGGRATEAPIEGTGGVVQEVRLTFEVGQSVDRWEFRTMWNGTGAMTAYTISLERT
jgi:hypothetical protein